MSDKQVSTVTANLIKAKSLIEDRDNCWTQGKYQDDQGRMCALGALREVLGAWESKDGRWKQRCRELGYLEDAVCGLGFRDTVASPSRVNDMHGHAAVMNMYDRAIALSMKDGESS